MHSSSTKMKFLFTLSCLSACVAGQVEFTCRPNCCAWMEQTYGTSLTDPSPRGFAQITLPNPEDMLSDPCITLTANSTNQYIEVLVETAVVGGNSRVCAAANNDPEPACGSGQVFYCRKVPATALSISLSCDDSCDLSDIVFWVRVNLSAPIDYDDEHWCDRRLQDYPSQLATFIPPIRVTNPPERYSAGSLISPSFLLLFALLFITISAYAEF